MLNSNKALNISVQYRLNVFYFRTQHARSINNGGFPRFVLPNSVKLGIQVTLHFLNFF